MIKFFRKIRQKLLTGNNFGKYIVYAIGEIVLVVVGILIAISLNNWKEDLDKKDQLLSILAIVKQDLETDSKSLRIIKYYEKRDTLLLKVLNNKTRVINIDSIDSTNYDNCNTCGSVITSFYPFYQQLKGYELLKNYTPINLSETDSLSDKIMRFYVKNLKDIPQVTEVMFNKIEENLNWLEEHPWYVDYTQKYNKEAVTFFHLNQKYKNKVATFRNLQSKNYLVRLRIYKNEATELIKDIKLRISKK